MLSITEYNYIKLLYDKFLKTNKYINELMLNNEWDSVDFAVKDKDTLIKQIMQFEKVHLQNIKENKELLKIRLNLIDLEKRNIELLKTMQEELKKEFSSVNKSKKVLHTYEPMLSAGFSTINISDDE